MRCPKKRSLLSVNEHFEGEHNDKIHFLFSLLHLFVGCRVVFRTKNDKYYRKNN